MMSSDAIGIKLLEILGLPLENCKKISLTIENSSDVVIETEYYMTERGSAFLDCWETEVVKYKLIRKE